MAPRAWKSCRAGLSFGSDGAWLVVAAATPEVNAEVAEAAEKRRLFVNAVDDPANASAYLSGVVRRDGVTVAISTSGEAPALTALLREALDAELPQDLGAWMTQARTERGVWRRDKVPMEDASRVASSVEQVVSQSWTLQEPQGTEGSSACGSLAQWTGGFVVVKDMCRWSVPGQGTRAC